MNSDNLGVRLQRIAQRLMALVIFALIVLGLSWLGHRPDPVVSREDLHVTEGQIMSTDDSSDVEAGTYRYDLRLLVGRSSPACNPCRIRYAVREAEWPNAKQVLTPGTTIRAWVDDRAPAQVPWVWQLEADGRTLRSYEDAVRLREELNRQAEAAPWAILTSVIFGTLVVGVVPLVLIAGAVGVRALAGLGPARPG
jgi:hypothetical protein